MALTFTKTASGRFDGFSEVGYWVGTVTFDSSYPTGGESYVDEDFGMKTLYHLSITEDKVDTTEAYVVCQDVSASKLVAFGGAGATTTELDEVANTTDLSGLVLNVFAIGLN